MTIVVGTVVILAVGFCVSLVVPSRKSVSEPTVSM
jgi:hypothetical protein